ncbi:MAG: glucose-6-phosphate isomerase [Meiothermus sp.]|uniref:glucose-6-phosphate isomerase n=1 Tax=Meiothermus sp. TaxID=1955249 RepID=UPI0025F3043F|nr:glucose-6-phosphate isomerase [Meiothermus sp.]MCS7058790.1 glucose-6-phosphate isomerase [Meiothermus sp.]MCS7195409.1 glucose-6-phosphate isomerase [Meiothermus sp.]MCX7740094.1 glucose-6-phosphate isomerase [Meiothermus sp.]MDW8090990.1 glucose-6-phosphate isomerase [Meiothermus sp.]MDW8482267.1 glucose-6-phosphate isomerase [Meiothermus sp.]
MLKLDPSNISVERVGPNGVEWGSSLTSYAQRLEAALEAILSRKSDPGAFLGWIDLPEDTETLRQVRRYREAHPWVEDLVVLGIGGSALGAQAVGAALGKGPVRLHFVDNVEPEPVLELLRTLNPEKTLVNVISKSGTTAETMAAFLVFRRWLERTENWRQHVVVTTDPTRGILRPYAAAEGLAAFDIPPSVGGRFSVLSPVGTLPLAFAGVELENLLAGARKANEQARLEVARNLPAQTALIHHLFAQKGLNIVVLMPYSTRLRYLPDWFVQLHDESLGKLHDREGKEVRSGTTAVRAIGTTDQHAQVQLFREGPHDKLVVFVRLENPSEDLPIPAVEGLEGLDYLFGRTFFELLSAEAKATAHALAKAHQPNYTLLLERLDAYHLGWLLQHLMWQTAYLGELWGINAFDQPGVELGKEYTYALMGRKGYEKLAEELRAEGVG